MPVLEIVKSALGALSHPRIPKLSSTGPPPHDPALPFRQPSSPQSQSPLFSLLPLEIRLLIYTYVIQSWGWGSSIHIVSDSQLGRLSPTPWDTTGEPSRWQLDALTCVPCAASMGDPFGISGTHYGHWPRGHLACERIASWRFADPVDGPQKPGDYGVVGLRQLSMFLTCQRIYEEVSSLLYSSLQFDLLGLSTAHRFLTKTSNDNLQRIRSLHLSWQMSTLVPALLGSEKTSNDAHYEYWTNVCAMIQSMKGLDSIQIQIFDDFLHRQDENRLLEPLIAISSIKKNKFVVELRSEQDPFRRGEVDEGVFTGEAVAPFMVKRRALGLDGIHNVEITAAVGRGEGRLSRGQRALKVLCCPVRGLFLCVYGIALRISDIAGDKVLSIL